MWVVLQISTSLFAVFSGVLLFYRREMYPMRVRQVLLVEMILAVIILTAVANTITVNFRSYLVLRIPLAFLFADLIVVWFVNVLQTFQRQASVQTRTSSSKRQSFLIVLIGVDFVCGVGTMVYFYHTHHYHHAEGAVQAMNVFHVTLALVVVAKLWSFEDDNIGILHETSLVGIGGLVVVVVGTVFFATQINVHHFQTLTNVYMMGYVAVVALRPFLLTYIMLKRAATISSPSIAEFLQQPQNQDKFHKYLRMEFCSENLAFYLSLQQDNPDYDGIYLNFIASNAPFYVNNIPHDTAISIHEAILKGEQIDVAFGKAQESVLEMMQKDNFPRFWNSLTEN
jgi:hypothetical protein